MIDQRVTPTGFEAAGCGRCRKMISRERITVSDVFLAQLIVSEIVWKSSLYD